MDRRIRRFFMRRSGLHALAVAIGRHGPDPLDAVTCVLDEIFGKQPPLPASAIARCVRQDVSSFQRWLTAGIKNGRRAARNARGIAVVMPDSAPYECELLLVNAIPDAERHWVDAVAWRGVAKVRLALLDRLLPRTKMMAPNVAREADYILPIAYPAFLLRGTLCGAIGRWRQPEAVVIYEGGDDLLLPRACDWDDFVHD